MGGWRSLHDVLEADSERVYSELYRYGRETVFPMVGDDAPRRRKDECRDDEKRRDRLDYYRNYNNSRKKPCATEGCDNIVAHLSTVCLDCLKKARKHD